MLVRKDKLHFLVFVPSFCCTVKWPSHIYIYIYIYIYMYSFSHTIFHHVLSQEIGYSSLCCTVGPHRLSILSFLLQAIPTLSNLPGIRIAPRAHRSMKINSSIFSKNLNPFLLKANIWLLFSKVTIFTPFYPTSET